MAKAKKTTPKKKAAPKAPKHDWKANGEGSYSLGEGRQEVRAWVMKKGSKWTFEVLRRGEAKTLKAAQTAAEKLL